MSATRTSGHLDSTVRFAPATHEDAAVGDETVDTAGGLYRHVTTTSALRGDLRDVRERPGSDGYEQPVGADVGDRALDGLLVGANRPRAELDDRAVPELRGDPIHDRPGRRAIRAAVAEYHRSPRQSDGTVGERVVKDRGTDADVHVG